MNNNFQPGYFNGPGPSGSGSSSGSSASASSSSHSMNGNYNEKFTKTAIFYESTAMFNASKQQKFCAEFHKFSDKNV